jgi:hypothetical protein
MATGASVGRVARGIGRAASARSMRCNSRTSTPSPIKTSPPTAAIMPGVTADTPSWATPIATREKPAALVNAPNTNKNKYIPVPCPDQTAAAPNNAILAAISTTRKFLIFLLPRNVLAARRFLTSPQRGKRWKVR